MVQTCVPKEAKSPCCDATIDVSLGDGVMIGSCSNCGTDVCRINPRTRVPEWLCGKSPWYPGDDLHPMDVAEGRQ